MHISVYIYIYIMQAKVHAYLLLLTCIPPLEAVAIFMSISRQVSTSKIRNASIVENATLATVVS